MSHVAANADLYAEPRQNIFFPGVTPDLDGQCVSLAKWFMQEMSDTPNPQAARGDARYVGQTLVMQGLAVEVPYADRKRGDIICYEFGQYGHIATQLSGGRVFEENVNMGGVASKVVAGSTVYASRIGSETEAWRATKNPHVYRLLSYYEGDGAMNQDKAYRLTSVNYRGMTDVDPEGGQADYWAKRYQACTTPDQVADVTIELEVALGADDYKGDPNFRYKGRHYNEDMTTAKSQAYAEGLAAGGGSATVLAPGKYAVK